MALDIRSVQVRRGGEGCLSLDVVAAAGLIHADVVITKEQAEAVDKAKDKALALAELVKSDERFTDKAINDALVEKARQDAVDAEMVLLAEKLRAVLVEAAVVDEAEPVEVER